MVAIAFGAWELGAGGMGRARAGAAVNAGKLDGVAIKGYDTVAYFTDGHPMKGSPELSYKWLGETWYFASAEHRDLFVANPIKYAPQYGGYCAMAMSDGEVGADVQPETGWRILDGKLYLFAPPFEEDWNAGPEAVVAKANAQWPTVEAKLATH